MNKRNLPQRIPEEFRQIIKKSGQDLTPELVESFIEKINIRPSLDVPSLWEQPEFASSFWIYLMTGINQNDETDIAKNLLFWKAMSVKDQARVVCLQSSDPEFAFCSSRFEVQKYPVLLLGTSSEMQKALVLPPELILDIAKDQGKLQRFLTEIHFGIVNGKTLEDINTELVTDKIIKGVKALLKGLGSLIKVTFKASS